MVKREGADQKHVLHLIGNAHIDPVWMWRVEEGRQEVIDTCRAALERIEDTPGFIFCRSSAAVFEWLRDHQPELLLKIAEQVAAGRWALVGGWWVQPDCNIPCGESLVRQALYGKRLLEELFGVEVRAGYNVDTFGHAGSLPQILSKCGLDYYVFFRPGPHEKELPATVFWWQSADGSRVLASRPPGHYGTGPEEIEERIRECADGVIAELGHGMCFYGVGNHGGGPTKQNLACIARLSEDPELPRLEFSTPERFFDAVRDRADCLPVVADDLQHHARGCYSAVSHIKKGNRKAEIALLQAEKLAACAAELADMPYPRKRLTRGWKHVLFNQFHDILAGTSVRPACERTREDHGEALRAGRVTIQRVMSHVGARTRTAGPGWPVILWNSVSWPRDGVAETEVVWPRPDTELKVVNAAGREVPAQTLELVGSGRGYIARVAFRAQVPALGYSVCRVVSGTPSEDASAVRATPNVLENEHLRVTIDAETGWLAGIWDKDHGVEALGDAGDVAVVLADDSDTWSHGVDSFRDEIGAAMISGLPEVVEAGPVRAKVRVWSRWADSVIERELSLCQGSRVLRVDMTVDWQEKHQMLKVAFPLAIDRPTATYEIPYGTVVRATNGEEEPGQKWIDVTGTASAGSDSRRYGVSLLNDCKHAFDVMGSELRMTVLRSPIYAFHDPRQREPGRRYDYTDQGVQTLTYAVVPHAGTWKQAGIPRAAWELNSPLGAWEEPAHDGPLPDRLSFLELRCRNAIAEVVKRAEDDDDLVVRCYETDGRKGRGNLCLQGKSVAQLSFDPFEIKTLKLSRTARGWRATEVDMLERPLR